MWLRTTVGVYAHVNAEGELVDGDVIDMQSVSGQFFTGWNVWQSGQWV